MNKHKLEKRRAAAEAARRTLIGGVAQPGNPTHVGQLSEAPASLHKTIGTGTGAAPMADRDTAASPDNPTHPNQLREETRRGGDTSTPSSR